MKRAALKSYGIFAGIFVLAVCFRFIYLGTVPNAVSGDELHYVITAKSVYLTGRDLTGTWNPWSLLWFRYPPGEHQAELPYLLHLLSGARYPFSLLLIKLPFALLSVGIVALIYGISLELFGPFAAVGAGALAAINPWLIVMGRTGYEATPAMFFYLLSCWVLLKAKGRNILWTIVPLLLAFYSYIGTKVIIVPFTAAICMHGYMRHQKQYARQYMTLMAVSVIATIGFWYVTKIDASGSRLGELFLPNSPAVSAEVDVIRKTTIATPLLSILINKYTVYGQIFVNKLFRILSPAYLFVEGDQIFLPIRQGFFYYLDAAFLLVGAVYIGFKHRAYGWVILSLVTIGMVPQLISTTAGDFSTHLTLMFPFLIIIMGTGIAWTIGQVPARYRMYTIIACIALYCVNVAGFSETYFYRSPLIGYADFPKRILTKYLTLATARHIPVTVYTSSTEELFQKYMLYSDAITSRQILQLREAISSSSIRFNGVHFLPCQAPDAIPAGTTTITDALCGAAASAHHQSITTLTDGGENYIIGQDTVCNVYALKRYPDHMTLADFTIERLSEKQFCQTYISQR